MENKLISMTSFIFYLDDKEGGLGEKETELIFNYAQFLKQPLTLGMFVPVDKHGVILEDLKYCCNSSDCGCMGMPVNVSSQEEIDDFFEAQEKGLFKGFEFVGSWGGFWHLNHNSGNILLIRKDASTPTEKQLLAQPFEIELSESALKQIGLKTK